MLVLTRKSSEAIKFDENIYFKLGESNTSNEVTCYIYNRLTDIEEKDVLTLDNTVSFLVNNQEVTIQLLGFKSSKMYKLGVEAPLNVSILRERYVKYLSYVESLRLDVEDDEDITSLDEFDYDDDYEEETVYKPKYKDDLAKRYESELSWFFN